MEFVMPVLEGAWRYVLTLRISDYLDIALMAYAIYWLLKLVGTSKVESVGKVILLFLLALMLSDAFSLNGIYFLLSHILSLGALALIVLFQPEIRRLIDQLGSSRWRSFNPFARTQQVSAIENAIAQTVLACTEMSKTRTGVLIVFEREMALDDIARTGTIVDARVSSELLKNIFFVKAAMHDGAVIMRDGRLLAGGCMLPLSKNVNLSRDLGMRHRAGIGMSEASDAVVVIVSEETGTISVAIGGMLKRHLAPPTLETYWVWISCGVITDTSISFSGESVNVCPLAENEIDSGEHMAEQIDPAARSSPPTSCSLHFTVWILIFSS